MKKSLILIYPLLLIFTSAFVNAQAPVLQAEKSLGGNDNDFAYAIRQTKDGGYIVAGQTNSNNGNVHGSHGDEDMWIVKLNKNETIKWQKALGGTADEAAFSVQPTSDGGYIAAGQTSSNNGQVSGNHGNLDFWVVKLDSSGNLLWQKALGGSNADFATSIQQTTDGGYIVAGGSNSNDGDVTGHHGSVSATDYWIVKLDASGNKQWQKSYGGTGSEIAMSIIQTKDGGYIAAGNSTSNNGDVSGVHDFVYGDFWIVKLDTQGNLQWQKALGGSDYDQANSIRQTTDGGYVAAGWTRSNDGNVRGNHGNYDFWIVKLSSAGSLQWQKTLGGTDGDLAYSIQQTKDNGYVVAGGTSSNNGDVSGNHGREDYWVTEIDDSGNLLWQKALGGSEIEEARSVDITKDGGCVVAGFSGFSNVNNGDVTGNHGGYDFWITKLSSSALIASDAQLLHNETVQLQTQPSEMYLQVSPNPAVAFLHITALFAGATAQLSIVNSAGIKMVEQKLASHTGNNYQPIDISTFSPGLYYISLQAGRDVILQSFVKK